ncbi:MAG: 5-oxoprolinase subunit PxpA [Acidobacteriota bacterium]
MAAIDINCDLGEGFGIYRAAPEEDIFPLITSANIACGFHAGDAHTMRKAVELCVRHGVALGAHPGTPDLQGFGRRPLEMTAREIEDCVLYQIGALESFARAAGTRIRHVKPHGWIYNEAAANWEMAVAVGRAVRASSADLILFGLSGSRSIDAARQLGLACAREAFIDRSYEPDGSLTPRKVPGALILDPAQAAKQAVGLAVSGRVQCRGGSLLEIAVDTLCVHGDNPAVLDILALVRQRLTEKGVDLRAVSG